MVVVESGGGVRSNTSMWKEGDWNLSGDRRRASIQALVLGCWLALSLFSIILSHFLFDFGLFHLFFNSRFVGPTVHNWQFIYLIYLLFIIYLTKGSA